MARFPEYVDNVIAMMSPAGVGLQVGGRMHPLRATPRAAPRPAGVAARLLATTPPGWPPSGACPTSSPTTSPGSGTAEALALYRSRLPARRDALAEPRTFLTVNAVVADRPEEAGRLALPQLQAMVALRTGGPLRPQRLVEEAEADPVPAAHESLVRGDARPLGDRRPRPPRPRGCAQLAGEFDVDEVMVHPVAGAFGGTAPQASPPVRRRWSCSRRSCCERPCRSVPHVKRCYGV